MQGPQDIQFNKRRQGDSDMMNDSKLLASKILGHETAVVQILDKYAMPVRDQNKIIDHIANIERTTTKLVLEKQKEIAYLKKYGKR